VQTKATMKCHFIPLGWPKSKKIIINDDEDKKKLEPLQSVSRGVSWYSFCAKCFGRP
jgi:hypothetical protein